MDTIGYIGLGNMGAPMAVNIQKAGYPMVVYDTREEAAKPFLDAGARLASSPAELARLSDVTMTSLPGPKEVEEVATGPNGILEGIKQGSVYVDLSTSRPSLIRELEPKFRQKGVQVLDAPVLSSPTEAPSKKVFVMVGGDRATYERLLPIFQSYSNKVIYAGALGQANVLKIISNMMSAGVRQVVSEGLTLGIKAGLDLNTILEPAREGWAPMSSELYRRVFSGNFDSPSWYVSLFRKDQGLATELGRENSVPMPVANLVEQMVIQGVNRGWSQKDFTIIFTLQEEMAGVQVRGDVADQF